MKKINWQFVMFTAVILMLVGFCVSVLGLNKDQHNLIVIGLAIISIVCVSWWLWVMFVIKTMLAATDKTTNGLLDIKTKIGELKELVQGLLSNQNNK